MPFCRNCGSAVEGQFCQKCGTPVAAQAVNPMPQPAPPVAPAAKKSNALIWVGVGCLGLVVIAVVVTLSTGLFVEHKVRQAGFDTDLFSRNPGVAITKMLAAANPDLDVVRVNEDRGEITIRQKSTGKTLTMNLDDAKHGRMVFKDENGEVVSFQGDDKGSFTMKSKDSVFKAGAKWDPPDWIPVYTGAEIQAGANTDSPEQTAGAGSLKTTASTGEVMSFYEDALKSRGLQVTRQSTSTDGVGSVETLVGQDDGRKRYVSIIATPTEGGASIHINYSVKK